MKLLLMVSAIALVTAGCVPPDAVQRNLPHQRDSDSSSLRFGMFKAQAPLPDRGVGVGVGGADAADNVEDEASTQEPASPDADEGTTPTTGDEPDAGPEEETTPSEGEEVVPDDVTPPVQGDGPNRGNPSCENSSGNANTCR